MEIKEFIKLNEEKMIADLRTLVSYNSVSVFDKENKEAPFGQTCREVLDKALEIYEEAGMKVKNVDNYAGYAEVGQGDKLIGILGHLDVVPSGDEGWTYDPFELTRVGNKLFGRGSMDDKGPMVAALYAIKYLLQEKVELNKRIRLIVGVNEEKGSKCLDYYVAKEGHIDYGFTPDGSFPGIYGEKGHVAAWFNVKSSKIKSINGGQAMNAVCSKVEAEVVKDFDLDKLKNSLRENGLTCEASEEGNLVKLVVKGVAAHASMPELGKNAISFLMKALAEAGLEDNFVEYYNSHFGTYTDGFLLNCKIADKYGALTFNNGLISSQDDLITGSIDIRCPVTFDTKLVKDILERELNDDRGRVSRISIGDPLFFDPNSTMVQALVSAYREVTSDFESQPMVIGGGTYSKGINNCIAFGGEFLNDDNHIHDVDEFIEVDKLLLQTEIYVKAIMNLLAIKD